MTRLKETFQNPGQKGHNSDLTLYDYKQYVDSVIKDAVAKSPDDTRLLNHVAATLFSPLYDLQHKLAVGRPGAHFTDAEMKRVPFAQVRSDLQKGIDQFIADPDKVVSNDFWRGCIRFLKTEPVRERKAAPELAAA